METFLKYLGVLILLLGVAGFVVYRFVLPENWLLILSMALEIGGVFAYIFINKAVNK